jgi:hypothetical protein
MPTDETRRLLKVFGIAVTNYEDAMLKGAPLDEAKAAETEVRDSLEQIERLIERLRTSAR